MFRKNLVFLLVLGLVKIPFMYGAVPVFEKTEIPERKYFVGEKLTYQINYLGVPVGEAVSEVLEKTVLDGRQAYHIAVKVRSYRVIDLIYKVRDEHHSYVDAETLGSLSYSCKIREGWNKFEESSVYNSKTGEMVIKRRGETVHLAVPAGTQDQLSCGYFFRTLPVKENSSVFIPVQAEGKNWNMEVKTYGFKSVKIENAGEFQALETRPLMPFRGIFFRQGEIHGSISLDKRRIPLRMTVKIPILGSVSSELISYVPGKE